MEATLSNDAKLAAKQKSKQRALDRVYAKLERFDRLPDDAVIEDYAAAIVLNISYWTLRRNNPVPQRLISGRRSGRRVGDLRKLIKESIA
jgi:hypothetical protein